MLLPKTNLHFFCKRKISGHWILLYTDISGVKLIICLSIKEKPYQFTRQKLFYFFLFFHEASALYFYAMQPIPFYGHAIRHTNFVSLKFNEVIRFLGPNWFVMISLTKTVENVNKRWIDHDVWWNCYLETLSIVLVTMFNWPHFFRLKYRRAILSSLCGHIIHTELWTLSSSSDIDQI